MVDLDALATELEESGVHVNHPFVSAGGVDSITVNPHRPLVIDVYEDGDIELSTDHTCLVGPRFFTAIDIIRKHVAK